MKTKEELNALKNEVSAVNKKLAELSEGELGTVTGGAEGFELKPLQNNSNDVMLSSSKSGHGELSPDSFPHNLIITKDGSEFG